MNLRSKHCINCAHVPLFPIRTSKSDWWLENRYSVSTLLIPHKSRIIYLLQVGKKPEKITYVGIHNRRTDYLEFRRKRLKLDNLYEDYFEDAMEYFREEYWDTTVVFVYVSDDMKWGRRNLKDSKNLFFLGNLVFNYLF